MTPQEQAFADALRHPEFSHTERIVQDSTPMLVAYRHDPASSAGKGWLASIRDNSRAIGRQSW